MCLLIIIYRVFTVLPFPFQHPHKIMYCFRFRFGVLASERHPSQDSKGFAPSSIHPDHPPPPPSAIHEWSTSNLPDLLQIPLHVLPIRCPKTKRTSSALRKPYLLLTSPSSSHTSRKCTRVSSSAPHNQHPTVLGIIRQAVTIYLGI